MLLVNDLQSIDSFSILESGKAVQPEQTVAGMPPVLMRIGGIFQRSDTENANKRVYSDKLWTSVLDNKSIKDRLSNRAMMGEADHPESAETSIERISHVVTKLEKRPDKTLYGEADIFNTPRGRIVATIIGAGCRLGISSRGDGSVENKDGVDHVKEDDFSLDTFDFVVNPSTLGAYPAQLQESVDANERNVLEALRGFVNESADDVKTLVEAHQLINHAFEKTAHPALRDSLLESISQAITNADTNQNTEITNPREIQMLDGKDKSVGHGDGAPGKLSEEDYLRRRLSEANDRVAEANQQVVDLTGERVENRTRLLAAEDIIDEFVLQVEELQEQLASAKEHGHRVAFDARQTTEADEGAHQRVAAATELLDEALDYIDELKVELAEKTKYAAAAEDIVAEYLKIGDESKVTEAIAAIVVKHPNQERHVRKNLKSCKTIAEVEERYIALRPLLSDSRSVRRREPIAPSGRISEGSRRRAAGDAGGKRPDLRIIEGENRNRKSTGARSVSQVVAKVGS